MTTTYVVYLIETCFFFSRVVIIKVMLCNWFLSYEELYIGRGVKKICNIFLF